MSQIIERFTNMEGSWERVDGGPWRRLAHRDAPEACPGYPNCKCVGKSQWSSPDDPHGTFGAPGGMGG